MTTTMRRYHVICLGDNLVLQLSIQFRIIFKGEPTEESHNHTNASPTLLIYGPVSGLPDQAFYPSKAICTIHLPATTRQR